MLGKTLHPQENRAVPAQVSRKMEKLHSWCFKLSWAEPQLPSSSAGTGPALEWELG